MNYKTISDNPAFKAGKKYGRFIANQIMPHTVKKRKFYLSENTVYINDGYVTFNIIEIDIPAGKITVNICKQGHHTIDTFELLDLNGCAYFEYGDLYPKKFIYRILNKERDMNICDTCILNGRCDGRCGDTDPLFYAFEEENDYFDYENEENDEI